MASKDFAKDTRKYASNAERNSRLAELLQGYRNGWTIDRIDRIDVAPDYPQGRHGWEFHRA